LIGSGVVKWEGNMKVKAGKKMTKNKVKGQHPKKVGPHLDTSPIQNRLGWKGVVLLVCFKMSPRAPHTDPFQGNPMGKCTKKPGNNIIIPNTSHNCTWTHFKQIQWESV